MMIKKSFFILIPSMLLLAACATPPVNKAGPVSESVQLNQICVDLKQQIVTESTQNAPSEFGDNPTKQAQLYKEYEKYQCDQFSSKN